MRWWVLPKKNGIQTDFFMNFVNCIGIQICLNCFFLVSYGFLVFVLERGQVRRIPCFVVVDPATRQGFHTQPQMLHRNPAASEKCAISCRFRWLCVYWTHTCWLHIEDSISLVAHHIYIYVHISLFWIGLQLCNMPPLYLGEDRTRDHDGLQQREGPTSNLSDPKCK